MMDRHALMFGLRLVESATRAPAWSGLLRVCARRARRRGGVDKVALVAALGFAAALELFPRPARAEWFPATRIPITYRTWKVERDSLEATIWQIHAPIVSSLRFSEQVDFVLSTAYVSSRTETDLPRSQTSIAELASMSDVKAQIFVHLADDRFLVQVGTNAPSGAHSLSLEELAVVQSLSHPILGFRLKHYGEGWNTSAGLAAALPIGDGVRLGLGSGFVYRGEYEFVEGAPDFRPGSEVSASAGLDFVNVDEHAWLRIDTTFRSSGADQIDGEDVYEEGAQIELDAMLESAPETWQGRLEARFVSKQDDSALSPSGSAVAATKLAAGSSTRIGGDVRYRTEGGVTIGAAGQWSSFTGSDRIADANAIGGGPLLTIPLGSHGQFSAHGLYLAGTVDEAVELDLSGFELGVALAWISGW